ncbi:class II fructose-bisphosphate aldolase [Candidatus Roseilinea sp. NK_OTU-006]|jgi:fructose/tagatose bisphosphate aldolase|uniref:class II fructose-bisphosphate aldolase n=1 Tax=Candidatus Roseilinea sp. NK_OTU-006 TaxID=2704250 RepID=UPI001F0A257F|nr:class II fructose-bisphosphate aldolase [Candidatus Roseilinea sp. NK_OTU-006]
MSNTLRELLRSAGDVVEVVTRQATSSDPFTRVGEMSVQVRDQDGLCSRGIDVLVNAAVFGTPEQQAAARWLIWEIGQAVGIRPASIHELYVARGRDALGHTFTTPAMNIRMMAYDTARAAFRAAVEKQVGALIFEIARSEMTYTEQRPAEYTTVMIAAAIKEGFRGPLFIQGDHFQVNAKKYKADADAELSALRKLIDEAMAAGFYNIDIDTSTLVDLSKPTLDEQQHLNYELCALFSDYIRQRQPAGVIVSLGGEIGEVGQKNSDVHELRAFMSGYLRLIKHTPGISKISIQTGTTHGGVVLPDGSIADVNIDFDTLRELSTAAREEYGMGGAVQHGASTLPEEAFGKFVQAGAIEVHLATAFQQIAYAHLPKSLNEMITHWLFKNAADERKPGDTDEQFLYKTRKKATGPFKKELWSLPESDRARVRDALYERFRMLFNRLGVEHTKGIVESFVTMREIHKRPEDFGAPKAMVEDVRGLAD